MSAFAEGMQDPQRTAIVEILTRFANDQTEGSMRSYVDEIVLAGRLSHEEARWREIALDQAARTTGSFDNGKTIRKRAEHFLRFLRDGERRKAKPGEDSP